MRPQELALVASSPAALGNPATSIQRPADGSLLGDGEYDPASLSLSLFAVQISAMGEVIACLLTSGTKVTPS